MVRILLRLEGLAVFLASIYFYYTTNKHESWVFFVVVLFLVDLSMVGYLINKKLGAFTYNLGHNYILGLLIILIGLLTEKSTVTSIGLILTAHVGMDRFFGFGLKYPTSFKDTHIQKI